MPPIDERGDAGTAPDPTGRGSEPGHDAPLSRTFVLLERALAGDRDSERELYSQLRDALARAWRRHPLASKLDASVDGDDLVNQALLRAFEKGPTLGSVAGRAPGSLRGLLVHVLDGVIVDCYRSQHTLKRTVPGRAVASAAGVGDDAVGSIPASSATPSQIVSVREIDGLLLRQLENDSDREVWRLHRELGLESPEISARVGCEPEAVRRRLRSIRGRLSHWMELHESGRARAC